MLVRLFVRLLNLSKVAVVASHTTLRLVVRMPME